jgi:hypothetical protein
MNKKLKEDLLSALGYYAEDLFCTRKDGDDVSDIDIGYGMIVPACDHCWLLKLIDRVAEEPDETT